MRTLLLFLLLVVAASAQLPTRVLIYKGTGTVPLPPNRLTYSAHPHAYFVRQVVSPNTYSNTLLLYYTTGAGKKATTIDLSFFNTLNLTEAVSPTRTVGVNNYWVSFNDSNGTGLQSFYTRGDLKPIEISPGAGAGSFPKNLTCAYRDTEYTSTGNVTTIIELNFALAFDAKHTLAANSSGKDYATILADLQAELNEAGYH